MFKVGDNVMLKMTLAEALRIDFWIKDTDIEESVVYIIKRLYNDNSDSSIKVGTSGLWLKGSIFKHFKSKSVGFVIED